MTNTTKSVQYILDQLKILVHCLSNEQYSSPMSSLGGSSIGQHVRHIYDFYNCIVKSEQNGQIDFSCRDRNPDIETDIAFALNRFTEMFVAIEHMENDTPVKVLSEYTCSMTEDREWLNSTYGRELMYGFDHSIHHLAIIKVGIRTCYPDVILPAEMGVAPSTIKHTHKITH